jgi:hypothetical protein
MDVVVVFPMIILKNQVVDIVLKCYWHYLLRLLMLHEDTTTILELLKLQQ